MTTNSLSHAKKLRQVANDSVAGFVNENFSKHRDEILEGISNNSTQGLVKFEYMFTIGPVEVQAGGQLLMETLHEYFTSPDMGFEVYWYIRERGAVLECEIILYW